MAGEADELVVHRSGEAETAGMECGEEPGEAVHGMTRQPNQFGGTAMVDPQRCFAVITECRGLPAASGGGGVYGADRWLWTVVRA
jgi:hypothetical protein